MHPALFDQLRERLLREGVAARHVHRFIRELREHYSDLLRDELARASSTADAQRAALERLGAPDALAGSVLAQPALRSVAARFPRVAFGVVPLLIWAVSFAALLLVIGVLAEALALPHERSAWGVPSAYGACLFFVRAAPVLIGAAAIAFAIRQRVQVRWAMTAAAVMSLIAGSVTFTLVRDPTGDQLGVSSALLPFLFPAGELLGARDLGALAMSVSRAAVMFALAFLPFAYWRHRGSHRHPMRG